MTQALTKDIMNLTKLILKEVAIFPTVTKDQLYRLCKSYNGHVSSTAFNIELKYLVNKGLINTVISDTRYEYKLAS